MRTDLPSALDIPDSSPEELRQPTTVSDLETITAHFRTVESLEQRYAEERLANGKVIVATEGYRMPRQLLLTLGEFRALQRRAREKGWK